MQRAFDESGVDFRRLRVWQEAQKLAAAVRPLCAGLRAVRRVALADQLERAVTSVHANIAESSGRESRRDRRRILLIARGSLLEAESLLAECASHDAVRPHVAQSTPHARYTGRLLAALIRSLAP